MLRSLIWFWRTNLAVVAAAAVATAVLTGALILGDSVRGSLRSLALDRLGGVEAALVGERFLPLTVADRVQEDAAAGATLGSVAPAILLRASAVEARSRAVATGLTVWGVEDRFAAVFGAGADFDLDRAAGQPFPSLILNESLAAELSAGVGDAVVLSFAGHSEIPTASLLGRRDSEIAVETARFQVVAVVADRGAGSLALEPHQAQPLTAFARLADLGTALDAPDRFNVLLAGGAEAGGGEAVAGADRRLRDAVAAVLEPEDLGLRLVASPLHLAVESDEFVLRPTLAAQVEKAAREAAHAVPGETAEPGAAEPVVQPILTYLANSLRVGDLEIPYSTVTALDTPVAAPFGDLVTLDGQPAPSLGADQILLNSWAARELAAERGDRLEMTYYTVGVDDRLATMQASFEVAGVVEVAGLGADPTLTPELPGITDAERMSSWDPPFPVDLDRVRPQDEAYWDEFRGTPKAFISLATGQRLWRSRFGELTAVRVARSAADAEAFDRRFRDRLTAALTPEAVGYRALAVRERALTSSSGASDFSGLFVAFSFFLIVSAALLVGLLFRLAIDQRRREVGVRLALGFPLSVVRRGLLAEGVVLAAVGAVAGAGLAVAYASLLLRGIGSWWSLLIQGSWLELHVSTASLVGGAVGSVLLVIVIEWLAVRRLQKLPLRVLLAGGEEPDLGRRPARRTWIVAASLGMLAIVLGGLGVAGGAGSNPALFFAVAATLLLAGLLLFRAWCRDAPGGLGAAGPGLLARMAAHNSARHPGRSLLSVTLVACATFLLVSLEAVRKNPGHVDLSRESGTGGFALIGEADTPLTRPLAGDADFRELGLSGEQIGALQGVGIESLRLLPGEDVSCLNLYQPEKPRVLGVPRSFVERGGFTFQEIAESTAPAVIGNPWEWLEEELEEGVIPAIGDYNSVLWILHLGLGRDLMLETDDGETVRLRLVGLLKSSIFQSELLISEANFLRYFPSHSGYRFLLAETSSAAAPAVRGALETGLARFGLDVSSAPARLAAFEAVENTYLTTFQVLGALGLLLGTVGLAVVQLRNTLERRAEMATLRAFGYPRRTLAWVVQLENAFLLAVGLTIGAGSGLAAVAPHLLSGSGTVPWQSLGLTLAAVVVSGLLAGAGAVAVVLRTPLLPVLKAE